MKTATAENRSNLINMAHGSSGHARSWIERVIYEATAEHPEMEVYLLHCPRKYNTDTRTWDGGSTYAGTLEHATIIWNLGKDEDEMPPIEDYGRRVPAEKQQPCDCLRIYD